jgi:hypothetical protein
VSRLAGGFLSHSTSMRYWQDVRRHCSLCAFCDRQHGMPHITLRAVFQATVVNKISYAASAWWGYTSAADHDRLEAFLRRAVSFGYRDASAPSLARICEQAEEKLFSNILLNDKRLLRPLLPPERSQQYSPRRRRHNLQLPFRTLALSDNNFFN